MKKTAVLFLILAARAVSGRALREASILTVGEVAREMRILREPVSLSLPSGEPGSDRRSGRAQVEAFERWRGIPLRYQQPYTRCGRVRSRAGIDKNRRAC